MRDWAKLLPMALKTTFLKDYRPPDYSISKVDLTFDFQEDRVKVHSSLKIFRTESGREKGRPPLILHGEKLKLLELRIDGEIPETNAYGLKEDTLHLYHPKESFTLNTKVELFPQENKALYGLFESKGIFCTQNEPEGFRRITYFIDRPDVMSRYTTKIIAGTHLPTLLSNGNLVEKGKVGGCHYVLWEDPFPKPSYLFALVAGDLGVLKDQYTTKSGRVIDCRIYAHKGLESKCRHAMNSLKKAMRWDEETFGLECDLDTYMIVAIDAFNMGAMENKGLNIFNSSVICADKKTATDTNFLTIESVVAHEYFHNWTGNRVTCRDWFQLTLKEGLTIYRDQEFSSDLNERLVERIRQVSFLKSVQFAEDNGPTAHPIRPASYIEINNFYTATVYQKGAEVVRMLAALLGKEGFRSGMDRYFELFDGQAVTTQDFLKAMSEANGEIDLSLFERWYHQVGTPTLHLSGEYLEEDQTFTLEVTQDSPLHCPLKIGLLDQTGEEIPLSLEKDSRLLKGGVLSIQKEKETFVFRHVSRRPVLSANRDYSAPVKIDYAFTDNDLALKMEKDPNEFNRYEAAQLLAQRAIFNFLDNGENTATFFVQTFGALCKGSCSRGVRAELMALPTESLCHQERNPIPFQGIHKARMALMKRLGQTHKDLLMDLYRENEPPTPYSLDEVSVGKRALRIRCLELLASTGEDWAIDLCREHFSKATNMTDELAPLMILQSLGHLERKALSKTFFSKWKGHPLVMQKWLASEAGAPVSTLFERLGELEETSVYDPTVPNLVMALWRTFAKNFVCFHREDGEGYRLMADRVLKHDPLNPQMAARLALSFTDFNKLPSEQKESMQTQLLRLKKVSTLSKNVRETVEKILSQGEEIVR